MEDTGLKIDDGKEIEVYLGEGAILLHKQDQLELSVNYKNYNRMIEIKNRLAFLGNVLEREHIQKMDCAINPDMIRELKSQLYHLKRNLNDEVIIANRDWRFYLGLAIEKFTIHDKVILKTSDGHLGSTMYMPSIFKAEGIEISQDCKSETGRLQIEKKNVKLEDGNGKSYETKINIIVLEKGPELKEQEEIELCSQNYVFSISLKDKNEIFKDSPDFTKFKLIGRLTPKKKILENYENKYKGKFEQLEVNKLNLTKIPSLFMYTSR